MKRYFTGISPQRGENHLVHTGDCPFMPVQGESIYLGIFQSVEDAMEEGRKYFSEVSGCLFCSGDKDLRSINNKSSPPCEEYVFLTSDELRDSRECGLVCGRN